MRVVFMGTPDYATEILKALIADEACEVAGLVTQPDKPVGRRQIMTPPDTKRYLQEIGSEIEIFQSRTLREEASVAWIRSKRPDFIVVAAFGQILPREVLEIAPCINLHASLLPKYRGASPIQAAIAAGDRYSGVTAMRMDVGLDTGDILGYSVTEIGERDAAALFGLLSQMAAKLTVETLHRYARIAPLPQLDCDSSYAGKITKADGEVDFADAESLYRHYLAYIFWPGIYLPGGLKLKKIALHANSGHHRAGEILEIAEDHIVVGCETGALRIDRVQPPSKKEMDILSYIRGKRLGIGDTLA